MALKDRIDHILNLLSAASQRQDSIRDLANQLRSGVVWRSKDGLLQIELSPDQERQLEDAIVEYTTQLENIIIGVREAQRQPAPE